MGKVSEWQNASNRLLHMFYVTLLSSSLSAYTLVFSWHHSLISILRVEVTSALSTSGTFVPRPFALRLPPFKLGKLVFLPLLVFPVNFVFREEKFLPLCVELRKPLRFRRLNWGCVCAFVPGESSSKPSYTCMRSWSVNKKWGCEGVGWNRPETLLNTATDAAAMACSGEGRRAF